MNFTVYFVDGGKEVLNGSDILDALIMSDNHKRPFAMYFPESVDNNYRFDPKRQAWEPK